MRAKHWKSLVLKVQHLSNELDDRLDLLNENKMDFERLVQQELGDILPDIKNKDTDEKEENDYNDQLVLFKEDFARISESLSVDSKEESKETKASLEEPPNIESEAFPKYIKKLWKLIAKKTHPDITGNDEWIDEYNRAAKAYAEKEYEIIMETAIEIGIKLPEPDEEISEAIEGREEILSDKLKNIEHLSLWMFINADEKRKKEIVRLTAIEIKKKRAI